MQYSKLGSINYPKYSTNNNLSTQYILVILHPKAMAQAKQSQSQSLALAFGLAWIFSKPEPPQAKPEHHYWWVPDRAGMNAPPPSMRPAE